MVGRFKASVLSTEAAVTLLLGASCALGTSVAAAGAPFYPGPAQLRAR
jgi:hypothetical protein